MGDREQLMAGGQETRSKVRKRDVACCVITAEQRDWLGTRAVFE